MVKQLREHPLNIQGANVPGGALRDSAFVQPQERIASLQQAKDSNQCKNPTGYLKKALIEGWQLQKLQYLAPLNATPHRPHR